MSKLKNSKFLRVLDVLQPLCVGGVGVGAAPILKNISCNKCEAWCFIS